MAELIFKSNWLDILQSLGIPGRILVPPVTQIFRSKWLSFFFQCIAKLEQVCGQLVPYAGSSV